MENQALNTAWLTVKDYTNPLFTRLILGLREMGHRCDKYEPGTRYDYVFICNVAGPYSTKSTWELKYPYLDTIQDKIVFIDPAEYGWWTHDKIYATEYYNAFAPLSIVAKGTAEGQLELLSFLRGKSFPYFVREKYKNILYPNQYYPIDYPLIVNPIVPNKKPNKDEYMKRTHDVYVRWGGSHIFRPRIIEKIKTITGFKIDVEHKKINPIEYYHNTQDARISVVSDGYGSGSFRETEVLINCLLFMKEQCIEKHHPLTNGVNFVEFKVDYEMSAGGTFSKGSQLYKDCNIAELLQEYMSDWDKCYSVYASGFHHCVKYYSISEFAKYVFEGISKHNYLEPTPIEGLPLKEE